MPDYLTFFHSFLCFSSQVAHQDSIHFHTGDLHVFWTTNLLHIKLASPPPPRFTSNSKVSLLHMMHMNGIVGIRNIYRRAQLDLLKDMIIPTLMFYKNSVHITELVSSAALVSTAILYNLLYVVLFKTC